MKPKLLTLVSRAALLCTLMSGTLHAQPVLTIDSFLREVRLHHIGLQAAQLDQGGVRQAASRSKLIDAAQVYANVQAYADGKISVLSALEGSQTEGLNSSIGVLANLDTGLQAKFEYRWDLAHLPNASKIGDYQIPNTYYDAGPSLILTQSFWRNASGAETKSTKQQVEDDAQVTSLQDALKIKQILTQAETAYWRFLIANETVAIQTKALERATQMLRWIEQKNSLLLMEASDVYQAKAALSLHELELQAAEDEAADAERSFNTFRGQTQLVQVRNLPPLSDMVAYAEEQPTPAIQYEAREDALLATQEAALAKTNVALAKQKLLPSFDVNIGITLNQFETDLGHSFLNTFSISHPTLVGGFLVTFALDQADVVATVQGLERQQEAAKWAAIRKGFEVEKEWEDALKKLTEAKKRLVLSLKIEKIH